MTQLENKPQTKRERNISLFINSFGAVQETFLGKEFLHYKKGKLICLALFNEKGFKPEFVYSFATSESYNEYLTEKKKAITNAFNRNLQALKEYDLKKAEIQKGSILYSSWGYEQTNIDFYIVLNRKNDFITIQEIGQIKTFQSSDSGTCIPDATNLIGEPFKKKISKYASVKFASFKSGYLCDDTPKHFSSYH